MVAALSGAFVLSLEILGGPLAMVVYLLATLSVLNPGRSLQNVAISVGLPLALFLLFDRWLNASLPPDSLGLLHGEAEGFNGAPASPDGVGHADGSVRRSRSGCPSR